MRRNVDISNSIDRPIVIFGLLFQCDSTYEFLKFLSRIISRALSMRTAMFRYSLFCYAITLLVTRTNATQPESSPKFYHFRKYYMTFAHHPESIHESGRRHCYASEWKHNRRIVVIVGVEDKIFHCQFIECYHILIFFPHKSADLEHKSAVFVRIEQKDVIAYA